MNTRDGGEQGIRFARLRSLGRSRSQQSTGLLLCAARPSTPAYKRTKSMPAGMNLVRGGPDGSRTHDFYNANVALSQLSYGPIYM